MEIVPGMEVVSGAEDKCSKCRCTVYIAPSSFRLMLTERVTVMCRKCGMETVRASPGEYRPGIAPGAIEEIAAWFTQKAARSN